MARKDQVHAPRIWSFVRFRANGIRIKMSVAARCIEASLRCRGRVAFGMYYVYVLRSISDNGLYIGYSNNLRLRFRQHQRGRSFATVHRGPWKLIYYEAYLNEVEAVGRERYVKSGAGRRVLKMQLRNYLAENPLA